MTEWIISSTVLMLIIIGLRVALKGRISLGLQYALWLLVLVRLLVPVNFTESALSVIGAAERAMEMPAMQMVTQMAEVHPEIHDYAEARAQVAAEYEARGIALNTLTKQEMREFDRQVDARRNADYSVGGAAAYLLRIVWVAGAAVTAACLLVANLRFSLRLRRSRRALPVPGCLLPVYVTGAVDTPCLFGLLKPAIYLPVDSPWDEAAMEHILTHEGIHYRHGDHIWAVLRCVCLALHWYNPLVWVCAALSRRDGELACDEASIRALGEGSRAAYGRTLIDMTCQDQRGMVGLTATTMNYSAKSLKERIRLIARHPKTAAYTLVLVIALAALAVGCTFTGTPEETAEPTEPPTESMTEEVTEEPTELLTEPVDNRQLEFQNLFRSGEDWLYNMAAGVVFTRPQDVDLYYLFYNGVGYSGGWDFLPKSDRVLLENRGFMLEMDLQVMPAQMLEKKLQRYFGVGLDEVRIPTEWVYSVVTDTYYSNHNDALGSGVTVNGYAENEDGTVTLYMVVDAVYVHACQDYHRDELMFMTLRPSDAGWQMVSNVIGSISASHEHMAKIDYYQNLLGWSGGLDYFRALGTTFNTPEDADLYYFFYGGADVTADWDELDEYERNLLLAQGFSEDFDIQKLPGDVMEERLQRYFGLGLDAFRIPEEWASDPETETWYTNHSDAWLPVVTVTGVEEYEDGTVRVYLRVDCVIDDTGEYVSDAGTVLTLRRTEDGSYRMVSHMLCAVAL
ncbi:MAG: M56 family metallopeptidase [Oscillospiraceae bacterium]|nr:M56 family metallopeptidase [Oscillospiraceae bacterium]